MSCHDVKAFVMHLNNIIEPVHQILVLIARETSKGHVEHAHARSLARPFAARTFKEGK